MKRKLLSWMLIACMCLGAIPTYVLTTKAAEETEQSTSQTSTPLSGDEAMEAFVRDGWQVVTPETFGMQDSVEFVSEQTDVGETISMDKLLFSANVTYTGVSNNNFYYLKGNSGKSTSFQLNFRSGGKTIYFYNYFNYKATEETRKLYIGDTGNEYETENSTKLNAEIADVGTFQNKEVKMWLTTEFVKAPWLEEGEMDDLKIGVWFNGKLYDNKFFYVLDCKEFPCKEFLQRGAQFKLSSPFVKSLTTPEGYQMPAGYRVVTPLTFGVPDHANAVTKSGDWSSISLNKLLYSANVTHNVSGNGNWYYLLGPTSQKVVQLMFKTDEALFYCGFDYETATTSRTVYIGDEGEKANEYPYTLTTTGADLNSFLNTKMQVWITTEFVKAPWLEEGAADDLKIGLWFNGKLYDGKYFYVLDCKGNTYNGYAENNSRFIISSPIMELSDMGMVAGEYADDDDGEFYDETTSPLLANKVMDGTTFHSRVRFEGEGGTLYYGSSADASAIKLTSTSAGIQVSRGNENIVLLDQSKVGVDVLNNSFDLKLTTEVINCDDDGQADDVKLGIYVNNNYRSYNLVDAAATLTATAGVKTQGDATVFVGEFGDETPKQVYWCLDNGAYTKTLSDFVTRVSVNGANRPEGIALNEPGTYGVAETKNGKIYMEDVVAYHSYDINENQNVEIKDLVRMLKVEDEETHDATIADLGVVGKVAIGYMDETSWDATPKFGELVLDFMREALVGGVVSDVKVGTITEIDEAQLTQYQGQHGAFTSDFNITVSGLDFMNEFWVMTCDAKYISVNGNQPTIQYQLIDEGGKVLYPSPVYEIGQKNANITREWRVTPTIDKYDTVKISFVIPDGVALFINDFSQRADDEVIDGSASEANNGILYSSHTGISAYAPGNTIKAFEMAGQAGYSSLITIIKFTKATEDEASVPVCFHDDDSITRTLRYLEDGSSTASDYKDVKIENFTYSELVDTFSAGAYKDMIYLDQLVPTLDQFLDICVAYDMDPVFSVHPTYTKDEWSVVRDELVEHNLLGRCYIKAAAPNGLSIPFEALGKDIAAYSFVEPKGKNYNLYELVKEAGLVTAYGDEWSKYVGVEFYASTENVVDHIERAKAQGFEFITVNEIGLESAMSGQQMRQMKELGVTSLNLDHHVSIGLNW